MCKYGRKSPGAHKMIDAVKRSARRTAKAQLRFAVRIGDYDVSPVTKVSVPYTD
jgi:hypothetical protein